VRLSSSLLIIFLVVPAGCRDSAPDDEGMGDDELATESDGEDEGDSSGGESGSDGDGSSSDSGGAVEGPIEGRPCPPDSTVNAANFGMPFMLTWCAGCHSAELDEDERAGAPLGIDMDTLDASREHLLRIYARSADDNLTMPPAGGPTEEEREQLGDWLACGAPE